MNQIDRLEADILRLPPRDRERVALAAWDSLAEDEAWLSDPCIDPEGMAIARKRDHGLESGQVETLNHEEFARRVRDASE
jgi:hypothetical protein